MAVFIFGAGATRSCSFIDSKKTPCLPPLDRDFFSQLQRVSNSKHTSLIKEVMSDVVSVFGNNFDVTMEAVFTTLEHTKRMIQTTGEAHGYSIKNLAEMKSRLEQAIAVVLEESLTEKRGNASSIVPRECVHHKKFVEEILKPEDVIITFNYDCVLDYALKKHGSNKWNPHTGYGFIRGSRGSKFVGYKNWEPKILPAGKSTVKLYKLHGSLHFMITEKTGKVILKERPYTKQHGNLKFSIIPPEWHKQYDKGAFATLWKRASGEIYRAEKLIFIGYSVPTTDLHSTALFRTSVRKTALTSLVVVNPDRDARKRTRSVLERGFTENTKVLSLDSFEEFLSLDRTLWD